MLLAIGYFSKFCQTRAITRLNGYRPLQVLTVQYADGALAQSSRDKTHLGYLKDLKRIDRVKRVETGETRPKCLKYFIWIGLRT